MKYYKYLIKFLKFLKVIVNYILWLCHFKNGQIKEAYPFWCSHIVQV